MVTLLEDSASLGNKNPGQTGQTGRGCQAQDRLINHNLNHLEPHPLTSPSQVASYNMLQPYTICQYAYPCLQWHHAVIYSPREHQRSPFHKITELHCKVSPLHMALLGTPTDIRLGTSGRSCTAHHLGVNGSKNWMNNIHKLDFSNTHSGWLIKFINTSWMV